MLNFTVARYSSMRNGLILIGRSVTKWAVRCFVIGGLIAGNLVDICCFRSLSLFSAIIPARVIRSWVSSRLIQTYRNVNLHLLNFGGGVGFFDYMLVGFFHWWCLA